MRYKRYMIQTRLDKIESHVHVSMHNSRCLQYIYKPRIRGSFGCHIVQKKRRHKDRLELRIPSTLHEGVSACLWHTYAVENPIRFASKRILQYKNKKLLV